MRERTVLLVVVALVVSTASAGVAVNLLRPSSGPTWVAFDLSLAWGGNATLGSLVNFTVSVRQGMLDPRTLPAVYLSLDVGSMGVASSTPASNPWGYPTVWNLTGLDLTTARTFNVTATPTEAGGQMVYAMVWAPLQDLHSVQIDATGHVNPSSVTLETVQSASVPVAA